MTKNDLILSGGCRKRTAHGCILPTKKFAGPAVSPTVAKNGPKTLSPLAARPSTALLRLLHCDQTVLRSAPAQTEGKLASHIIIIIIIIIIAFKDAIQDFLQSPHCATNSLQHVR